MKKKKRYLLFWGLHQEGPYFGGMEPKPLGSWGTRVRLRPDIAEYSAPV